VTLTPDELIIWQSGSWHLTATVTSTWLVMVLLVVGSWLITRRLTSDTKISRGQNLLEVLVLGIRNQIRQIAGENVDQYVPFIGTLFVFIAVSNLLGVLPGIQSETTEPSWHHLLAYHAPTGSLSATAALALCVFFAVPIYGITQRGLGGYLKQYIQPAWMMLPFNIIGELSRTLALAVRLFGNVMSGSLIVAILLLLVPFFFPVVMHVLGLITGLIQAYIFAILAMVYIASATRVQRERQPKAATEGDA